ncbi:arginyltransferase [Alkalilimnicola sp. S0819]|uniref:arginyltransferase n=1 Tax=Alkalilimnicola sp. S0819 TaxID=2613922 RepID=UPI001261E5CD|nr:arginyltransferase [Alkalilimnicola sp. S0819]KAB7627515.1 arginyltransferase [Alkalilimnicola sp. S0819]MPQ15669.1 arginyltransferase [Alkalilimnicola sp. S0819]
MQNIDSADQARLSLFGTGPHPCAYLTERVAQTQFVDPGARLSTPRYSALVQRGFRRSGQYVYRPRCPECSACQSLRVPVAEFTPRRRHQRCLRRNADLQVRRAPAHFDEEHFALYRRYVASRHAGGDMDDPDPHKYMDFLHAPWCDTGFYEFRAAGRLMAVTVVDELPAGLSAVYTFFDPEASGRGLGTLAILWLMQYSRRLGLPHVYLGYWIGESPKMAYKADYHPHEIYTRDVWRRVEAP